MSFPISKGGRSLDVPGLEGHEERAQAFITGQRCLFVSIGALTAEFRAVEAETVEAILRAVEKERNEAHDAQYYAAAFGEVIAMLRSGAWRKPK